jgi:hypothetical protein
MVNHFAQLIFLSFLVDVRIVVACLLIFEVKLGKKAMPYPFFKCDDASPNR